MRICLRRICSDNDLLLKMSASLFEDYVLLHSWISVTISKYCSRYTLKTKVKTIARSEMSCEEIRDLLINQTSKGYLLNLVLADIVQYSTKMYNCEGYSLHRKMLDVYSELIK